MNRLVFNSPNGPLDLYTPRFVRGSGGDKVGLCPICIEPVERGGRGLKMFAKTKVSAYNYHLQYYHGISSKTGLPYSPPIEFRTTLRDAAFEPDDPTKVKSKSLSKKTSRKNMMEGRCHACGEWVALQGTKDVDVLVKELYWWKHAASCHRGTTIAGEGDYFVHDEVWARIREFSRQKEFL
ncbi:hypothetical protein BS47DRAFT_1299252 [Hydnum rufescens UP504]|uniref:Transcription regulator Rua1 C-terminal domain-containing protein n=1 Tax=Hydnum rufescens UP504 TaxID=1448309 RepID=A0A9P6ASE1_9AGAM|nr:hypothetical protein BS47DRAFT_1299252 [Hydnum rufescens UP504]